MEEQTYTIYSICSALFYPELTFHSNQRDQICAQLVFSNLEALSAIKPHLGEATFYRNVGLWQDGLHRCNLVLATPKGVKEPWAVFTDEPPTLQTLWQYALRFRVEELFQG